MAPRLRLGLGLLLLGAGLWQFGDGLAVQGKALVAQILLERSWSIAMAEGRAPPPWPWADTVPVARLAVPRLAVDQIVLSGATGRTLAFGPGLVDGTAPGRAAVISGHRDTHFTWLAELRIGDLVTLQTPDARARQYRVIERRILDSRSDAIHAPPDADLLFLTTCYPFGAVDPGGPLRAVFAAVPDQAVEISSSAP